MRGLLIKVLFLVLLCDFVFSEPLSIAIEYSFHSSPVIIAEKNGYFLKEGISVNLIDNFKTGMQIVAGLQREEIPMACLCITPAIYTYERGIDLMLFQYIHDHGYSLAVRNYKSNKDLEKLTFALPREGGPLDLLFQEMCVNSNVKYQNYRMPPQKCLTSIINKKVDCVFLPEPFSSLVEEIDEEIKIVKTSRDFYENYPGSAVFVKRSWAEKNKEKSVAVKKAIRKAIDFIEKNPKESAEILAEYFSISVSVSAKALKRINYKHEISEEQFALIINLMKKHGFIKSDRDFKEILKN